uniref:Ataxin-10 domain-containing protein n=2 Tax=Ditylum brightwellii TaxID=49249 RepID=A0A7S4QZ69_9STRA|mmetsp:Transcript_33782/g.44774  ORF Transcript_33782/g.44774 Transcript_33782/m.44774 type:complete len:609 (+) Transcript_33782:134-1960(+)
MAEDQKNRPALSNLNYNDGQRQRSINSHFDSKNQLFPETARWCLCAMKNLTRPSKDPIAAHAFIDAGVIPLILKIITVGGAVSAARSRHEHSPNISNSLLAPAEQSLNPDFSPSDLERQNSKGPIENDVPNVENDPSSWDANSMQDAALFTILNLSATSVARNYLREEDAVHILATVADFATSHCSGDATTPEEKQQQFQCLKARMALAYLVGSEGHYGQPCVHSSSSARDGNIDESVLLIMKSEAELLVEMLANSLHQRTKSGSGGYSAATFSIKGLLFAIRCLLTNNLNQNTLANSIGEQLNCLLFKALAQHSIQKVLTIDPEAAEHACFSLYLLSNFGFKSKFLPASFSNVGDSSGLFMTGMVEIVLTAYLQNKNITQAGRHAAEQLLMRLPYLTFIGSTADVKKGCPDVPVTDFDFDNELLHATDDIVVKKCPSGAKPRGDIFGRPILRSRAPKKGTQKAIWDNKASVAVFPSALHAVQQLSFGSTKVRHMDTIDDIAIANNIANCASGEDAESYNYWWSWQDSAHERKPMLEKSTRGIPAAGPSAYSFKGMMTRVKSNPFSSFTDGNNATRKRDSDEPFSIFGMSCGHNFCAQDTSVKYSGPR